MYNKIRKKFILLSLAIITGILVFLFGGINIATAISNRNKADDIISSYVVKMDYNMENMFGFGSIEPISPAEQLKYRDEYYFIVSKNTNEFIDAKYIVRTDIFAKEMSEEDAGKYYEIASSKSGDKGYVDNYRYLKANGKIYFLDCSHFQDSEIDFLLISILFSLGGIVIFFVCLFFGSSLIFRNVKVNDTKQKEFITDASHQLKTPLMVISANNDLISIKNGESEETKMISKQIEQMSSMISTLLTISKSAEAIKKEQIVLSVSSILNESVETFQPLFKMRDLKVECEIQDNINVLSDAYSINEIIKIILENASKYAKTRIKILLKKEGRNIELVEINDSEFKEDKDLNYLSERFVRDDANSKNISGSGIGLSLLKALLGNQKSTLEIKSKNGDFMIKIRFKAAK